MKVIRDGIKLCSDCMIAAVNGDFTGLDYYYGDKADARMAEIVAGLNRLGPHLVSDSQCAEDCDHEDCDNDLGFSWSPCDCCETRLGGDRFSFAILGE